VYYYWMVCRYGWSIWKWEHRL